MHIKRFLVTPISDHRGLSLSLEQVEEDFEWVTEKLVQIANSCCEGRIVSVLEGGYQLGGEFYSAFAQSAKVQFGLRTAFPLRLVAHYPINMCLFIDARPLAQSCVAFRRRFQRSRDQKRDSAGAAGV